MDGPLVKWVGRQIAIYILCPQVRHHLRRRDDANFDVSVWVNASLCQDLHGKTLSFLLLGEITVTLPRNCLPEGSPYL